MKFHHGWLPSGKMFLVTTRKNPLLAHPLEKIQPTPLVAVWNHNCECSKDVLSNKTINLFVINSHY